MDYALQRRKTIEEARRPSRVLQPDVCDADPLLVRSAVHHGESTETSCPFCDNLNLTNLNYVFGDQLRQFSGRIKTVPELAEMQSEFGEFKVCVVEVCAECGWNYMIKMYTLGDGRERKPPRRRKTVEDIYG